ncbi:Flp family type IVb pilin [Mesorhizobium sp. M0938]|uniref:Flp family type IVb pilin n=1 Tax=unclassified Mesorhizobium TaxID=325217 RepID=UPI00333535D4
MKTSLQRFLEDEAGATVIEYGLIAAVLSVAILAGGGQAFDALKLLFSDRLANALP